MIALGCGLSETVNQSMARAALSDSYGPQAGLLAQLIGIAGSTGAKVLVEGVDTAEQAARVTQASLGQGYFWHRPLPVSDLP